MRQRANRLSAMSASGAKTLQVGCRSGGCGVCRVQVLEGEWRAGQMSRAQIDAWAEQQGHVLACRMYPKTDLRLRAVGRLVSAIGDSGSIPGRWFNRRGPMPESSL